MTTKVAMERNVFAAMLIQLGYYDAVKRIQAFIKTGKELTPEILEQLKIGDYYERY